METNKETWILYQTTNLINSKIYVGVHKVAHHRHSRNYLGSGIALKAAIEKHGKENFIRTTLAEFDCAEDAYSAEERMVTEEFIKRKDTYNMKMGGKGCRGRLHSEETKAKIRATNKGQKRSAETRAKMSIIAAKRERSPASAETRAKMKKSAIEAALRGQKHPQSVAVMINEVYYPTKKLAAKAENVSSSAISHRIKNTKSKWDGWRYATDEEKAAYALGELQ
jgi:group I intron endonuclease